MIQGKLSLPMIGLLVSIAFSDSIHAVSVFPQDATTGADGAFTLDSGLDLAVPADGVFNYTDFSVDAGAYLRIGSDSPVFIYADDFQIHGSIDATVPELYLIGTNINIALGPDARFTNTSGSVGLFANQIALAGQFDVQQDLLVDIISDGVIPAPDTCASQPGSGVTLSSGVSDPVVTEILDQCIVLSGNLELNANVELVPVSDPNAGGQIVLDPNSVHALPAPDAALLFLSGLLGLFVRRRG